MTTTEAILNYAKMQGGTFQRKGLLLDVARQQPTVKPRAIDLQLNRLISSGDILHNGFGGYALTEKASNGFLYQPSDEEKSLFSFLKENFPFLEICIWRPQLLSSFMHHIPDIGYTFIDVEKEGMESVFHSLQAMDLKKNVLLSPSKKDCERYLVGSDAFVVRQLIGQSPLTQVEGCTVPRIEKILVDAIGDNELFFASGTEIYGIYETAFGRHNINKKKLLRYASRRNRETQVKQILTTIGHD